eukprot:scaffold5907_cov120-Isochrysis_galbana.AAC.13
MATLSAPQRAAASSVALGQRTSQRWSSRASASRRRAASAGEGRSSRTRAGPTSSRAWQPDAHSRPVDRSGKDPTESAEEWAADRAREVFSDPTSRASNGSRSDGLWLATNVRIARYTRRAVHSATVAVMRARHS